MWNYCDISLINGVFKLPTNKKYKVHCFINKLPMVDMYRNLEYYIYNKNNITIDNSLGSFAIIMNNGDGTVESLSGNIFTIIDSTKNKEIVFGATVEGQKSGRITAFKKSVYMFLKKYKKEGSITYMVILPFLLFS